MKLLNTYEYTIKKSRFIAYFYKLDSIEDAKEIIDNLWKEHKKATHIPYAYRFGVTAKKTEDKEPSGTAGMPILKLLERENLNSHLIAVVRYFGGTKLGVGPLLRSYLHTASECVKKL